jgi:hypothetical protein
MVSLRKKKREFREVGIIPPTEILIESRPPTSMSDVEGLSQREAGGFQPQSERRKRKREELYEGDRRSQLDEFEEDEYRTRRTSSQSVVDDVIIEEPQPQLEEGGLRPQREAGGFQPQREAGDAALAAPSVFQSQPFSELFEEAPSQPPTPAPIVIPQRIEYESSKMTIKELKEEISGVKKDITTLKKQKRDLEKAINKEEDPESKSHLQGDLLYVNNILNKRNDYLYRLETEQETKKKKK